MKEKAPVLLIIFNRPDYTARVMRSIRAYEPERLYVAADGATTTGTAERIICAKTRQIATTVDWKCKVENLFHGRHLGCRHGPSSAITWFLQNESEGIILEDDCVPSLSFFPFCAKMLEYYRDTPRVMCISGNNFQGPDFRCRDSYYFSNHPNTWGWATWARAWNLNDAGMDLYSEWMDRGVPQSVSKYPGFLEYWQHHFALVRDNKLAAWDYIWLLSCWAARGLSCSPRVNLVSNIGFGPGGTHCFNPKSKWANIPRTEMQFPLRHPDKIEVNKRADEFFYDHWLNVKRWQKNVPALQA